MELNQIARILREHERYCYQVAYFLLEREDRALMATERALLELGRSPCFLTGSMEERLRKAKNVTAKHSLEMLKFTAGAAPDKVKNFG